MVRALSGHDFRRRHEGIVNKRTENEMQCRNCEEDNETILPCNHGLPGLYKPQSTSLRFILSGRKSSLYTRRVSLEVDTGRRHCQRHPSFFFWA